MKTLLTIAAMAATPLVVADQAPEAPEAHELPEAPKPADPPPPAVADESTAPEVVSLEGTLVSQTPEEVVMRDGNGNEHHLRVTQHTRYVWSETTSPRDLIPGAHVRVDYASVSQQRLLVSLWILGRS